MLTATVLPSSIHAQANSRRSIRVITLEAGSQTDTVARVFLPAIETRLGQDFFVENHGGAGGRIAARMVAHAHDGHTIGVGGANNLVMAALLGQDIGYDPARDFVYIAALARIPFAIAVRNELPVRNIAELAAHAKRAERELTFGSAGVGGSSHLAVAAVAHARFISLLHIPFRGSNLATNEVVAGRIDIVATDLSRLLPLAESRKLRIVALTGSTRDPRALDIATLSEQGLTGLYLDPWYGLYGPRNMEPELRERLTRAIAEASMDTGVRQRAKSAGIELLPPTRELLESLIASDMRRYTPLIGAIRAQQND
jgi:tripartite-type tricarboxylate transporter receptor subunit TctC